MATDTFKSYGLILPGSGGYDSKLIVWLATAPAREVEQVARLALYGVWKGNMRRKESIEYIVRALKPARYSNDKPRYQRVRKALIKRGLLPEGYLPGAAYLRGSKG